MSNITGQREQLGMTERFFFFFCEKKDAQNKGVHLVYQDNPVESSVGYFIYLHKDSKALGMSLIISLLILLQ